MHAGPRDTHARRTPVTTRATWQAATLAHVHRSSPRPPHRSSGIPHFDLHAQHSCSSPSLAPVAPVAVQRLPPQSP